MNSPQTMGSTLMLLIRNWKARNFSPARREHDRAISDRSIAVEHQIQIVRSIERGESGCTFCR